MKPLFLSGTFPPPLILLGLVSHLHLISGIQFEVTASSVTLHRNSSIFPNFLISSVQKKFQRG